MVSRVNKKSARANFSKRAVALAVSQSLLVSANAATIVVNSDSDTSANGDGICTLREAVLSAQNDDAATSGCTDGFQSDTIIFADNLNEIVLSQNNALAISSDMTIQGNGESETIINGNAGDRIFYVSGGQVELHDLSLINGAAPNDVFGGGALHHSDGALLIDRVSFTSNRAGNNSQRGGGLESRGGTILIRNTTVSDNTAEGAGGGISLAGGNATIQATTIHNNDAAQAGGISVAFGTATVVNSSISDNVAGPSAGVRAISDGKLHIYNTAIVDNGASDSSSIITTYFGASITLANTIVSGNQTEAGRRHLNQSDMGTLIANRNNVFGDAAISSTDLYNAPNFTPGPNDIVATSDKANIPAAEIFQRVGDGPRFILPAGSPARDSGDQTVCNSAPVSNLDSRGFPRDIDAGCDIGAVEMREAVLLVDTMSDDAMAPGCTLRNALVSANQLSSAGGCGVPGDSTIINFDPAVFSSSGDNQIALQASLPRLEYIYSLTVNGRGNPGVTIDAGGGPSNAARVLYLNATSMSMNNIVVTGGEGGIEATNGSSLELQNCTIRDNSGANYGGGVYVAYNSRASIVGTTITGNSAEAAGAGIDVYVSSSLVLLNSTVSGNSISSGGAYIGGGGGISLEGAANFAEIRFSTITGNSARTYGGGVYIFGENAHELILQGNIIAGNEAAGGAGYDVYAPNMNFITDFSYNLFGSSAIDAVTSVMTPVMPDMSNVFATSDMLDVPITSIISPLGMNGGKTLTHNLSTNSPARNAIDTLLGICPELDQRGERRTDRACDIGAVEYSEETCFVVPIPSSRAVVFCL